MDFFCTGQTFLHRLHTECNLADFARLGARVLMGFTCNLIFFRIEENFSVLRWRFAEFHFATTLLLLGLLFLALLLAGLLAAADVV